MDPLKILEEEHRVIEKALSILENVSEQILAGEKPPVEDLEDIIDFIRTFADRCHHGKEEKRLFLKMEARGIPKIGGPIGVMLMEHEMGRSYVRGMREAVDSIKRTGDDRGYLDFRSNALGYVQLLREHIGKEDNILYPLARQVLNHTDFEELERGFEEVEVELGVGLHGKYIGLIEELYIRYIGK